MVKELDPRIAFLPKRSAYRGRQFLEDNFGDNFWETIFGRQFLGDNFHHHLQNETTICSFSASFLYVLISM
jgi:hypothetical protein